MNKQEMINELMQNQTYRELEAKALNKKTEEEIKEVYKKIKWLETEKIETSKNPCEV